MSSIISDFHYAVRSGKVESVSRLIDCHGLQQGYHFLRIAVENNDTPMVKLLLSGGCPVTKKNCKTVNDSPLHIAARNNNIEIIEMLLSKGANIEDKNKKSETPLVTAVRKGCLPIINLFLENGAYVNVRSEDNLTPLHIACENNSKEVVNSLLMRSAHIGARTQRQSATPLHLAAQSGSSDVVTLLLQHGAQVDCEDKDGRTALQIAVTRGELPIVEAVLKFHPDIQNENNQICLKIALHGVGKDFDRIISTLSDYGFAVNTKLAKDPEVLNDAVKKGNFAIVGELLKNGADPNATLSTLRSDAPLLSAVKNGHYQLAELLINSKALVDAKDSQGRPPLFHSIEKVNLKMTLLLLNNGANVKDSPEIRHLAVQKNSVEIVNALLLRGADVNVEDKDGRNALHFTVFDEYESHLNITRSTSSNVTNDVARCKLEVAQLLLNKGANVDAQTKSGQTALHAAVLKGLQLMVDFLLMNDANVNLKDKYDTTALHMSAAQGNVDICTSLLNKGAEINAKRKDGNTALHIAAYYSNEEVVKLLLDKGAHVNGKDRYDKTPLHLAADSGHAGIIEALSAFGANVNVGNKENETPLLLFSRRGHTKAVAALLDCGADINITKTHSYHAFTPLDYAWGWYRNSRPKPKRRYEDGYYDDDYYEDEYDEYDDMYFDRPIGTDVVDILIMHQMKMNAAGLKVTEPVSRVVRDRECFTEFHTECQLEVTGMKSEFFSGTNVSYYEILRKDKNGLAKFLKNERIALAVELKDYKNKFPNYASMIDCRFREGLASIKLLESASEVLSRLTELPEDCIEKIMDFLTEDDLTVLIDV